MITKTLQKMGVLKKPSKPKINKYEKISPENFIRLADKNPVLASEAMRKRYTKISDFALAHEVIIYKDENLKGWHKLAKSISENDPVLAKSVYISLLDTEKFIDPIADEFIPDMRIVSDELNRLEARHPEQNKEGLLAVRYILANRGFPDQSFWRSSLEKTYELASELVDENGHLAHMIGCVAFYAENGSDLQAEAIRKFCSLIEGDMLFSKQSNKPEQSKASLFYTLINFCLQKHHRYRNINFLANPSSSFLIELRKCFWRIVDENLKNRSACALAYLEKAMMSDDLDLSLEAADFYKNNFKKIASHEPDAATENLLSLARFSICTYSDSGTKHQNDLLTEVFDSSIEELYEIDKSLAQKPFQAFMGGHMHVPLRIKQKHKDKIIYWK